MSRRATLLTSAAPSAYDALVALDPAVLEAIRLRSTSARLTA